MAIYNPNSEATRAALGRASKVIDNGGLSLITILAPTGYRIARVDVSAGTVEFERMAVAVEVAKRPKRKAGR